MTDSEPRNDALHELLDVIYHEHHHDFRSYARVSLERSVARARASLDTRTTADLLERVRREPGASSEVLRHLTVNVSDLFRDAGYYRALRERVVDHLATYSAPRIWVAGCGTGEEAYSIAIVLHEQGLLERCHIYATDIDAKSLDVARAGAYASTRAPAFMQSYVDAGGCRSLLDHCRTHRSRVVFSRSLRDHISFSDHSLATDSAFAEVQLISCRNVLIYFGSALQSRALGLFQQSLCSRGFLGLGPSEKLAWLPNALKFEPIAADVGIYRMRYEQGARR